MTFPQTDGGDRDYPGRQPDEVGPGQGDTDRPDRPPTRSRQAKAISTGPTARHRKVPAQPGEAPPRLRRRRIDFRSGAGKRAA
jgi:hypothetical protein